MPDRLKSLLVDDWENITKNLQLVQLPSNEPAGVILDKYQEYAVSTGNKNSTERDILEEVVAGLKEYFNKGLGRLLLYRFEREQFYDIYTRISKPGDELEGKALADIYGGEHLLRLFGKSEQLHVFRIIAEQILSLNARAHRANEHGLPSCQPPPRRTGRNDHLAC
jgi:mortality factor 4-like protein 1